MTKSKESYHAKKTRKESEDREKAQKHISKILAKYEAQFGEPVAEIIAAHEDGIAIGKRSERAKEKEKQEGVGDMQQATRNLMKLMKEENGDCALVLVGNFKKGTTDGIIAAAGNVKDHKKLLLIASKADKNLCASILWATKEIVEEDDRCEHCGCRH